MPAPLLPVVTCCLAKDPSRRSSPAEIIRLCRAAADQTQLRRPEDWLPGPVAADITARHAAPFPEPTTPLTEPPAPSGPNPAHPAPTGPLAAPPTLPRAVAPAPVQPQTPGFQPALYPGWVGPGLNPTVPTGPHTGNPWYPPPSGASRPSNYRPLIILGSLFGALVLTLYGCTSLLGPLSDEVDRPADVSGASPSGSGAQPKPRPTPKPVRYPNVQVAESYYLFFADDPLEPREGYDEDDFSYRCNVARADCYLSSRETTLVLLNNAQKGSLSTCLEETRFTKQIGEDSLTRGAEICARTTAGTVALIRFKGFSRATDPSNYITVDVTVWRLAIDVE